MLKERTFTVVSVSESNPVGYNPEAEGEVVKYNGEKVEVQLK